MRRLPIYFLIDVSESMAGAPVQNVENGMRTIIQNLRTDPYALETVFVSIIAFAGRAETLSSLTELYQFYPPVFPIGGGTGLGNAMNHLMDEMDRNIVRTTMQSKGDWKPIIFLFTDGNPTDDYRAAFDRWNRNYRRHCSLVAISIGDNMNTGILGQLTEDVLLLKDTDPESFKKFFKWITASIQTTSQSVSDTASDGIKLAPTAGINLEKAEPGRIHKTDENFAVLRARCQNTKGDFLIKYTRRLESLGIEGMEKFGSVSFRLTGAYPIDRERYERLSDGQGSRINTLELFGVPTCPCCGNQTGAVICECGGLFCVGDETTNTCPWCGMTGTLTRGDGRGTDINRTVG